MNRLLSIRNIRTRLQNGQATVGSWMQIPHAGVAEMMGQAGYDWVAIDMEHGSIAHHQLPDLFRALELGGTLPLVRLPHSDPKAIKDALDAGSGGIIIPMVEAAEQLRAAIQSSCWPPAGIRGVGFSRANLYGKHFDAYREEATQPFVVAQIEHIRAVHDLDAILTVPGLDAIIIGPYDLSASMGITAQFDHPDYLLAMEKIKTSCQRMGKPLGLHVVQPDPEVLRQKITEGYQFLAYAIDAVFLNHAAQNPIR
jgi:2-dehydro-3-deoxyglucarate aldolase